MENPYEDVDEDQNVYKKMENSEIITTGKFQHHVKPEKVLNAIKIGTLFESRSSAWGTP